MKNLLNKILCSFWIHSFKPSVKIDIQMGWMFIWQSCEKCEHCEQEKDL